MAKGRFSGCFDLRLSRLRRDSRAAQHDKFERFFEEIDFPELWKSNKPTTQFLYKRNPSAFSAIIVCYHLKRRTMSTQPKADPELVEVFDTMQESEAMVVHGLLTSAGIESVIANLQAPQDVFPGVGGISIRVSPAQEEEARRLIDDYRANGASDDDSMPPESDTGQPS
jgi:hypothetical protein